MQMFNLNDLGERLKKMYDLVKDGKFSDALKAVNVILHIIPLTSVETRREVDELKELIEIARYILSNNYHIHILN